MFRYSLLSQHMKRWKLLIILITCFSTLALLNYFTFYQSGKNHMVMKEQLDSIPYLLIPGAGKFYPPPSTPNYAFLGRMDTAAFLWQQHPHMKLILSGYEDDRWYQEAHDMLDALVLKGVPDSVCILDTASRDTYATLMYYKENFKNAPCVIISQKIHLDRMLWMAEKLGLNARGYEAGGYPEGIPSWFITREIGARLKARLEIWGWIGHEKISND